MVCDGNIDCFDNSDEKHCTEWEECPETKHKCSNGRCIPTMWICDGVEDCEDGGDENNCTKSCAEGYDSCNDGKCIPSYLFCNGQKDCEDNEDESKCDLACEDSKPPCTQDINECELETQVCDHFCENNNGGYKCSCAQNYRLLEGPNDDNATCRITEPAMYLYYTTITSHKIIKVGLDGKGSKVIINENIVWPNGLALDYPAKRIFWVDANLDKIESSNYEGKNRKIHNPCEGYLRKKCSHICLLSPTNPDGYVCACPRDMKLKSDNHICEELGNFALISVQSNIYRVPLKYYASPLTTPEKLVKLNTGNVVDMDYNPLNDEIYIADLKNESISKVSLKNWKTQKVIEKIRFPTSVAVDWLRDNLYWINGAHNTIEVSRTSGTYRKKISENIHSPTDIALDVTKGNLYISDSGVLPSINKCELNGSSCRVLANSDIPKVTSLHVDLTSEPRKIYWTNAERNRIESIDEYGENRIVEIDDLNNPVKINVCGCSQGLVLQSDGTTCSTPKCSSNEWTCENGECIFGFTRCDGSADCSDGSDEKNCTVTCSEDKFQCKDGSCIENKYKCDGFRDCRDHSDEDNCTKANKINCKSNSWQCDSGECLPHEWRCDEKVQCEDGSDEKNCDEIVCTKDKKKCNKTLECPNREDEKFCECDEDKVKCSGEETCIFRKWICDNIEDCADGSDEKGCSPLVKHDPVEEFCAFGFKCTDETCISNDKVCDGHNDCDTGIDESGDCDIKHSSLVIVRNNKADFYDEDFKISHDSKFIPKHFGSKTKYIYDPVYKKLIGIDGQSGIIYSESSGKWLKEIASVNDVKDVSFDYINRNIYIVRPNIVYKRPSPKFESREMGSTIQVYNLESKLLGELFVVPDKTVTSLVLSLKYSDMFTCENDEAKGIIMLRNLDGSIMSTLVDEKQSIPTPCEISPCVHLCVPHVMDVPHCACAIGYRYENYNCTLAVDLETGGIQGNCAASPCKFGTCVDLPFGQVTCKCNDGYEGTLCEIALERDNWSTFNVVFGLHSNDSAIAMDVP
ncbi:Prolow-density lipoprotein receptor-related protein 1 [Armadillidium vulgare]|nr:Prolow-density lipoprotein receptor-related protein 1 [Armadillidium vulgare]